MVDQLSGMPLFEPHDNIYAVHDGKATVRGKDHDESVDIHEETKDHFLDDDDRDSIERTSVDEKVGKSDLNFDLLTHQLSAFLCPPCLCSLSSYTCNPY